jgi:hypothetical protein
MQKIRRNLLFIIRNLQDENRQTICGSKSGLGTLTSTLVCRKRAINSKTPKTRQFGQSVKPVAQALCAQAATVVVAKLVSNINASGSAASIKAAGIIGVAGNKAARTSDVETGLKPIFDADKTQKKIDAEVQIMVSFTKVAPKAAATFLDNQIKDIKVLLEDKTLSSEKRAELEQDIKDRGEGGIVRIAMHTVMGALSGGLSGAAGAAASASAAPLLNDFQDSIVQTLETGGMSPGAAKLISSGITGLTAAGVGAALGGSQGAISAGAVDFNNRQLHPTEMQWIKANASRYAAQKGISVADAERQLAAQAFRQVQFGVEGQTDPSAQAFLKTAGNQLLPGDPNIPGQNVGYLFYATPEQRANASMYLASSSAQADFYKQNGLVQPTAQSLTLAAQKDAELRANLSTATKTAMGVAATVALGGLTPTMLQWALVNPIAATQAGIISAETAAAIVSGAVTPTGLLQQMNNPQNARIIYNRLAAAATQNADSGEVVLGRYLAGNASSYEQVAQARGATYYEVKAWNDISQELGSREKMWEINKAFLDKGIADGKRFVFTSDPEKILFEAPRSYSAEEVKYLKTLFNFEKKEGLRYGVKK